MLASPVKILNLSDKEEEQQARHRIQLIMYLMVLHIINFTKGKFKT